MVIEKLQLGDKINYTDYPELFGDELTFEQLCTEPSSSLLIAWRSAFAGSTAEDAKQAEICRVERVTDYEDGDLYIATVMLDAGGKSPFPVEWDDMEETEPDDESDKMHIWNLYDRIWRLKQEETEMKPDENASETVPMLTEKQQAEALHKQITGYGEVIYQSLYGMCTAIKQMRDSKLYKALGYDTFEAYTEEKLGMKHSQAYRYIAIAEKYAEDSFPSMGKIGMTKLTLLTALTEDQREELTQTVDLESTTVRELKAQIAALQSQNADTEKARVDAEERAQGWYDKYSEQGEQIASLNAQIAEQSERIDELESRPVEVAVPEPSHELQNMQDAMRRINLEHEQWSAKIQDDHIRHVQEINRQHRAETDALRAEYEEKLAAAQSAESPAPDEKEIFKAYLANAIDAAKRMTAFLAAHPNEACRKQAENFFQTMIGEVST